MYNFNVQKESTESTFVDLQSLVRQFLVFCIVFIISLYIWEKLKKRFEKTDKIKTKNIPCFHYFSFWLPSIIETLIMVYKLRKEGLRIAFDWWASVNHSPVCEVPTPLKSVVITDPNLLKQFLGSHLTQFHHKPKLVYDVIFSEMLKDGLFASHPNIWKPHRKILNKYFTRRTLQSNLKIINKYGNVIIQNLKSFSTDQITNEKFSPILHDKILSIILEILFGEKNMVEMGTRELAKNFKQWQTLNVYRCQNPQNIIPFIWKLNPRRKTYLDSLTYLKNYVNEGVLKSKMVLENKTFDNDESEKTFSCVEHMLLHELSGAEILDEVSTILFGGHETTDTTFHFILQHLAEYPKIQRKCQDEIDSIFHSKDCDSYITMDDLSQLKYLDQCILETLRLTPTVPLFARELDNQIRVENFIFKKGTVLGFSPWLMHRNTEIYPEPEKFDPDRFLPENVKARHPYAFLPFSMGPRNCIGWRFAMMELKTIMALILRNFDISTSDKLTDVRLFFNLTLLPERNFNLILNKREL